MGLVRKVVASITTAVALAIAGAAFGQTPTPDPAPVPVAPAPTTTTVTTTSTATAPAPAEPVRKRKKNAGARADATEDAAATAHPPLAEAGPAVAPRSKARVASPPSAAHMPVTPDSSEREWPAGAVLLFLFATGLLGLVLAIAPSRLLATISAGLPERRQDVGLGLVVVMALGAGVLVALIAV